MTSAGSNRCSILVVSVFFLLLAPVSEASSIYYLTDSNFAGTGNFGTVTLTLGDYDGDGGADDISVDVDIAAAYVLHSNGAFGFNVVGDDTGLMILGLSNPLYAAGGTGVGFNGFGQFEYTIDSVNTASAWTNYLNSLSFYVTTQSGFTSDTQLAGLNANGWAFAAQIAPASGGTGFAAGETTSVPVVPEPTSLVLLGTGLIYVAARMRSRKARRSLR